MRPFRLLLAAASAAALVAGTATTAWAEPDRATNASGPPSLDGLKPQVEDLKPRVTDLKVRVTDVTPKERRRTFTLESDVLFAFDSARLSPGAAGFLTHVADDLEDADARTVAVTGHTDSLGGTGYNQRLSARRAAAVRDYLRGRLGSDVSLTATGRGEAKPVAPNTDQDGSDNPAGRSKNRRVTIAYRT